MAQALPLEQERFVDLFDTLDQKEGVNAFLEKRPPLEKCLNTRKRSCQRSTTPPPSSELLIERLPTQNGKCMAWSH